MIHVGVGFLRLSIEVRASQLPSLALHILCRSLIRLHDRLSLANVALAGLLRALHEDVLLDHFRISLLGELFSLAALLELLGDDAEALVPVQRRVGDLRLEWEVRDRCHIYILNLQ